MRRAGFATLMLVALAPAAHARGPDLHGEREVLAGDPPGDAGEPPPSEAPSDGGDLAKAADATAEVATLPSSAPADAIPASKSSSDDIDLAALGLESGEVSFDDKLNIYGFADFNYIAQHWARDPVFFPQDTRTFTYGNLNLYLAKNLTKKARALAEVRFTFLPNGTMSADHSFVETAAQDPADYNRVAHWGGIVIERAYAEYDVTDHLTLRGGHWLTPFGIWNIDHGSPVIAGTNRPFVIGNEIFPQHQTGLDLFGNHDVGEFRITGHVTASNGRGATEAQNDQDNKLAFGGRVEIETPWKLRIGGSYYRGRFTGLPPSAGAAPETFREIAYAGDAQFDHGPLHVQGEVIVRDRHYADGQRFLTAAGFAPDSRDFGAYALASYRFDQLWNVMPYFYGEDNRSVRSDTTRVLAGNWGLNFRPAPSLVFKLQYSYVHFADDGLGNLAGQRVHIYAAQTSWVF